MDHMKFETPDMVEGNIEKIAALFPSAVTEMRGEDGKVKKGINFEVLKQLLSKDVVDGDECYEFTWVGKKAAMAEAAKPTTKTLRPVKEDSKDWDTTENLYIEGDNLEVLKILQESYLGKVKMIYIDPPYNTGHDFIYPDSYMMDDDDYSGGTGYLNEDGEINFSRENSENAGKYHSDWCSMMYSRVLLARNLLSEQGVVFISIDEHEIENLKKICVEVFGQQNYIATLARKTKTTSNNGNQFAPSHEYIVVCCKAIATLNTFNDPEAQEDEDYIKLFRFEDDYSKYNIIGLYQPALKHGGSSYPIECPDGSFVVTPEGKPWRWNEQTFLANKAKNRVVFKETKTSPLLTPDGKQAKWNIYTKLYLKDRLESGMRPITFIDKYPNSEASKELIKMNIPFDFSKPRRLIQYLMKVCIADQNSLIMDLFAGSSTTAHAVMQLNAEDGGHRKYIMVQLPQPVIDKSDACKAGYQNICEIGEERIRRAGEKIKAENPVGTKNLDIGFRVFRVDDSNMKDVYYHPEEVDQMSLTDMVSNIKEDRTDIDLLYSCLLDWGVEINLPHTTTEIDGCTVHNVDNGALMACFNEKVPASVIQYMARQQPLRAVFRDSGFSADADKINVEETFKNFSPDTSVRVM